MNKLMIIGNLTGDPELRTTSNGKDVCHFNVAVNRGEKADFFKVSVWDENGRNCAKYLSKGKKVAVIGSVSARAFSANDGSPRAQMEIDAREVEYLSGREADALPT